MAAALADTGVSSFDSLIAMDPRRIEAVHSKLTENALISRYAGELHHSVTL